MAPPTAVKITLVDLETLPAPTSVSIADVKELASYSWIEAATPTIAVPGSPALWSPLRGRSGVKKDSGLICIAQNAARHPESPLEPLFRAIYTTNPSFDIRDVDVITDRNNIRKLLSFVDVSTSEAFTIEVEMAKNTAIFCRIETKTQEYIRPTEFRGFGHEFEKAYTKSQIPGGGGHHRMISYSFGGLKFIVRHKTDGYIGNPSMSAAGNSSSSSSNTGEDVSLSKALASITLTSGDETLVVKPPGSKLTIKKQGQVVPRASTLEIKTRSAHRPLMISEVATQLWVSQTPQIVRAYHHKGVFVEPTVENVTAQIDAWENQNQRNLRKLAALIEKIRDVVQGWGGKAVVRYDPVEVALIVDKIEDGKKALPKDLYAKWEDTEDSQNTSKQDITR